MSLATCVRFALKSPHVAPAGYPVLSTSVRAAPSFLLDDDGAHVEPREPASIDGASATPSATADAANAPSAHRGADPESLVLASAPASALVLPTPASPSPVATPSSVITAARSSSTVSSARTTGSPDPAPFAEVRAHPRCRPGPRRVASGTLTRTLRGGYPTEAAICCYPNSAVVFRAPRHSMGRINRG